MKNKCITLKNKCETILTIYLVYLTRYASRNSEICIWHFLQMFLKVPVSPLWSLISLPVAMAVSEFVFVHLYITAVVVQFMLLLCNCVFVYYVTSLRMR